MTKWGESILKTSIVAVMLAFLDTFSPPLRQSGKMQKSAIFFIFFFIFAPSEMHFASLPPEKKKSSAATTAWRGLQLI